MNKEQIIKNYRAGLYNPNLNLATYNRNMGIRKFTKETGCRYYLYPAYIDITDLFTETEIYNNFYVGDIMELSFVGEFEGDKPEDYFSEGWNPITGNGKWGE